MQRCPSLGDPSSPDPDGSRQPDDEERTQHPPPLSSDRMQRLPVRATDAIQPPVVAWRSDDHGSASRMTPFRCSPLRRGGCPRRRLPGRAAGARRVGDRSGRRRPPFMVLVDGAPVGTSTRRASSTCREPYVALVPCPASASAVVPFATSAIPNGRHTLQVAAEDAAGNRTVSGGWTVLIANGAVANGVGASRAAGLSTLRGGRDAGGRRRRRSAFGEPVRVNGRLVDAIGPPDRRSAHRHLARPARAGGDGARRASS